MMKILGKKNFQAPLFLVVLALACLRHVFISGFKGARADTYLVLPIFDLKGDSCRLCRGCIVETFYVHVQFVLSEGDTE